MLSAFLKKLEHIIRISKENYQTLLLTEFSESLMHYLYLISGKGKHMLKWTGGEAQGGSNTVQQYGRYLRICMC